MKRYKSSRSKRLNVIFILTIALIIGVTIPALIGELETELYFVVGINILTLLLLVFIILKTEYEIKNSFLYWQSGPFYGKIDINSIRKIEHHNGIFVPTIWKPALSQTGLILTYNKFDDIYISPQKEAEFIALLLAINPKIQVI
jgi:hypothetical protein